MPLVLIILFVLIVTGCTHLAGNDDDPIIWSDCNRAVEAYYGLTWSDGQAWEDAVDDCVRRTKLELDRSN
jgi:hypothetical protein